MNRRSLLAALAALPFLKAAKAEAAPEPCRHIYGTTSWDIDYNYRCVTCGEVLYNERDLHASVGVFRGGRTIGPVARDEDDWLRTFPDWNAPGMERYDAL